MTASITLYNSFRKYIGDGTLDLDSNTFKVSLHSSSYTPSASTHTVAADLTNELSTAFGYTSGGQVLSSITWTQVGAIVTWDASDMTWTAAGGSLVSRYAVIRASGTLNGHVDPLVAYILMNTAPADITVTNTNSMTLIWDSSGILVAN